MFNLKKYRHTLLDSVQGVISVQTGPAECHHPETTAKSANTDPQPEVCFSVTTTPQTATDTPRNTFSSIQGVNGDSSKTLVPEASGIGEHAEHQQHRLKGGGHNTLARLENALAYLSLQLNITNDILTEKYFTEDDINDISHGMYDNQLDSLAELIRSDGCFPFTTDD
ncbi:hypothetical protein [Endozoicomonas elysicola]|uniref:Uncharacterized protein n=1 Tax=Endozoicomonas elysicola TaxID=305900 RepID=A0A081K7X3_9GAMM|nr:hypothetical protein [Endozoicomonas elysicola]KEI70249.1 hypothetical protein GV64_05390 [Endozoicomonas elysicola]